MYLDFLPTAFFTIRIRFCSYPQGYCLSLHLDFAGDSRLTESFTRQQSGRYRGQHIKDESNTVSKRYADGNGA
jgi:hypothetical protein